MNTLVCPLSIFQRLVQGLVEDPRRIALARVGVNDIGENRGWLLRDFTLASPDMAIPDEGPVFRLALSSDLSTVSQAPLPSGWVSPAVLGHLYLGEGPWRGRLWGLVRTEATIEPLDQLFLVGAGMHRLRTVNGRMDHDLEGDRHARPADPLRGRWSRTIGALGGESTWERLVGLRIALVGCGRTGSLVAVTLARLGIRQLVLIDPDLIELHNLGEMDAVMEVDLGMPKAEAIASHLHALLSPAVGSSIPITASIVHEAALAAAKGCDVLICCADNDAARLATGIIATLYHKPLLDIGTGIFNESRDQESAFRIPHSAFPIRIMGADVRLVIPGDGCLLCRGNLTAYSQAVEDLCSRRPPASPRDAWQRERAGSLRSLNQVAAGLGVQMLQELVAERIDMSTWAHLEFDQAGQLTVQYPAFVRTNDSPPCVLCAKAGLADGGLWWTRQSENPASPMVHPDKRNRPRAQDLFIS